MGPNVIFKIYTQQGDEKGYLFTVGDEPFRIEVCRGACDQTPERDSTNDPA